MTRRLRWLAEAERDLLAIVRYVVRESGSAATGGRFAGKLRARCRALSRAPATLGRARPEIGPDIRSLAFGNHVILFRYRDGAVEIVSIVEGHRDLDALFAPEDGKQ